MEDTVRASFHAQIVEATTGIEPVYAVLQSPPERAPVSANVRVSRSVGAAARGSVRRRCYQPLLPSEAARHTSRRRLQSYPPDEAPR